MKAVYQTDASGVLISTVLADESPLEPGVWLTPAGCVDVPPPTIPPGNRARWVGGAWVLEAAPVSPDQTPAVTVAPTPDDLRSHAASVRFAVETGGVTVGAATIDTGRDSQSMIAGALAYVQASEAASVEFKAASGWVTLSAGEVKAIALAVGAHVQACFAAERDIDEAIAAGSVTSREQIDAWPWPGAA